MTQPTVYIVTGISGSGKTTVGRALIKHGEIAFDSKITPGIYRFMDDNGNEPPEIEWGDTNWLKAHKWSLNKEMLDSLLHNHADSKRVFLCGRANLFHYMNLASKTFLLKIGPDTLLSRLNDGARDNLFASDKATQQRLLAELDTIQNKIESKGTTVIDAEQSVDQIIKDILSHV